MKNLKRILPLAVFLALMLAPVFVTPEGYIPPNTAIGYNSDSPIGETRLVDIGDGEFIELGPNEVLHRYVLTEQGGTQWSGISSPLLGSEYGNSTNIFNDRQMVYTPSGGTTSVQVNIPTGTNWEAYETQVSITELTAAIPEEKASASSISSRSATFFSRIRVVGLETRV